ncbi:DUF826 domain-containing protein [Escherichia coli]|uniref:DUF826 domain-containing protein n=1 Tax=Escherichia coli TaxID=562 RepID=UPI001FCEB45D|nr:DUF826 domain-containing protein [Escherichia coli]
MSGVARLTKGPLKKSVPGSRTVPFSNLSRKRENLMSDINKLVTAEAVKDALRSEEVSSVLKQKIRATFEAQIDAEVDAILAELTGAPAEASGGLPEPEQPAADPFMPQ